MEMAIFSTTTNLAKNKNVLRYEQRQGSTQCDKCA